MIYLNGQQIDSLSSLSPRFQSVLSLIPGGQEWFRWCIAFANATPLNIATEDELLNLIVQGLNTDGYVRFNTFRAHMNKIMSLKEDDISQLALIKGTDLDNEIYLAGLLAGYNMLSYNDIAETRDLVAGMAERRPDLFQSVSFDDLLTLTNFTNKEQSIDAKLKVHSHEFALSNAATVPDFVNQSLFYQYAQGNLFNDNIIPKIEDGEIQAIYTQLKPIIYPYLFTPAINAAITDRTLPQAIRQVASSSTFIGYVTVSSAILNLEQNVGISALTDAGRQAAIENYLVSVRNLICDTSDFSCSISQNGELAIINFSRGQSLVSVGFSAGTVFLLPDTKIVV